MNTTQAANFLDVALDDFETYFTHFAWPILNPGTKLSYSPAIEYMCGLAQEFYEGKYPLCTLAIPPRNTKTTVFTLAFPTWVWLKNPTREILTSSSADEVLQSFHEGRKLIFQDKDYELFLALLHGKTGKWPVNNFLKVINPHKGAVYQWKSTKSRTGLGFHYGFLDDPISNSDANSDVYCEKIYQETIKGHMARRHDKKVGISSPLMIVQQRLSNGDLIGRLEDKPYWEHFKLPAICTERTIIQIPYTGNVWERNPGDVLNPDREDLETLLRIQEQDLRIFNTQYQQDPKKDTTKSLLLEKEIQLYDHKMEDFEKIIISVDTASSVNVRSANWGFVVLGLKNGKYYVVYAHAMKYNYPDGKAKTIALIQDFSADLVYIEEKSTGTALVPEMLVDKHVKENRIKIIGLHPGKVSKEDRFIASVPYIKDLCYFPRVSSMPSEIWVMLLLGEILAFPDSPTLDLADSLGQYFYSQHYLPDKSKKKSEKLKKFYGYNG